VGQAAAARNLAQQQIQQSLKALVHKFPNQVAHLQAAASAAAITDIQAAVLLLLQAKLQDPASLPRLEYNHLIQLLSPGLVHNQGLLGTRGQLAAHGGRGQQGTGEVLQVRKVC
jgi:hypothetical protein